jgi:signal transduction histidine kinase
MEIKSIPIERIIPPEAAASLIRLVDKGWAGETTTIESTNLRCDGSSFPARISATLELGPGVSLMIIVVEDITAEKQRRSEEEAIAEERRRIAREIHDSLAQDLAALRLRSRLWHRLVDTQPTEMHAELNDLREILSTSIREVRRSILALRPVALEEQGFFPALRQFIADFGEQYQLRVELTVSGPEERLPSSLELTLFRIAQETLNNVGRHALASTAWISLDLGETDVVTMTIRDDGCGFDPSVLGQAVQDGHLGLRQMRERVESANGTLLVQSQPGSGTKVRATLPLDRS